MTDCYAGVRRHGQIARTREWIETALIALAHEGRYRKITISELCRKAGIGRPTFYRHFSGIDDVMTSITERAFDELRAKLDGIAPHEITIEAVNLVTLQIWKKHQNVFMLMRHPEIRDVLMTQLDRLMEKFNSLYSVYNDMDPFLFRFRYWGMKGVLLEWVEQEMKASPEDINDILVKHWT